MDGRMHARMYICVYACMDVMAYVYVYMYPCTYRSICVSLYLCVTLFLVLCSPSAPGLLDVGVRELGEVEAHNGCAHRRPVWREGLRGRVGERCLGGAVRRREPAGEARGRRGEAVGGRAGLGRPEARNANLARALTLTLSRRTTATTSTATATTTITMTTTVITTSSSMLTVSTPVLRLGWLSIVHLRLRLRQRARHQYYCKECTTVVSVAIEVTGAMPIANPLALTIAIATALVSAITLTLSSTRSLHITRTLTPSIYDD